MSDEYRISPKQCRRLDVVTCESAWWYAQDRSIRIYMRTDEGVTVSAEIDRAQLLKYIEQTK